VALDRTLELPVYLYSYCDYIQITHGSKSHVIP
jgi:hypothetical protein